MSTNLHPRWKARISPPSQPDEAAHREYFAHNAETPPSAVLVFHGIGEEVRFETLGRAASLIMVEAEERGAKDISVVIRPVPRDAAASSLETRAELIWTELDEETKAETRRQVHVYEAYWAPLTAGKVSYLETMGFLVDAGWNGLRGAFQTGERGRFKRWLFGSFRDLKIAPGTVPLLFVLLLIVGFVAAMIAMAVSAAAGIAKHLGAGGKEGLREALNFVYGQVEKPWNFAVHLPWTVMGWFHIPSQAPDWLSHILFSPNISLQRWWEALLAFAIWAFLVWAGFWLKSILTAYVGSLVAYLSPYKDSKWDELRGKIQQVALEIGRLILNGYQHSKWIPQYENIVYVAHSLGSVIAYDALNSLINTEAAKLSRGDSNPAVERTRALITLGCPLNKTAYLFRLQFKVSTSRLDQEGELREMMVGAVQPLITDYKAYRFNPAPPPRRPEWINLWSRRDIISGDLNYYDNPDVPETDPRHIQNKIDPEARIPLAAHNQYWTGKLLRKTVYDELF